MIRDLLNLAGFVLPLREDLEPSSSSASSSTSRSVLIVHAFQNVCMYLYCCIFVHCHLKVWGQQDFFLLKVIILFCKDALNKSQYFNNIQKISSTN